MNKPDDVSAEAWEMAEDAAQECFDASVDLYETGIEVISAQAVVARAIDAAIAKSHERTLDAANAYMTEQYGISALGNPIDRGRIAAAIRNPSKP